MTLNGKICSDPWTRCWDDVEQPIRFYVERTTKIEVGQLYLYPSAIFEEIDEHFQSLQFQIENKIKL